MSVNRVTGVAGVLRWGSYTTAATLHTWALEKAEHGAWSMTATLADVDDFAVSQRPLKFIAPNGWAWPITSLQRTGTSCTATLGPKESDHVVVRPV